MAMVILLVSRAPERMVEWVIALVVAKVITLALLLFAERLGKLVGERGLLALERLMGLALTAIAFEMLLRASEALVRQSQGPFLACRRPMATSLWWHVDIIGSRGVI